MATSTAEKIQMVEVKEKNASEGVGSVKEQSLDVRSDMFRPPPVNLAWKNVSFSVGDKKILNDLSGIVRAGELCAVMGPSGSGKTTLMDFVASRIDNRKNRQLSGKVFLNGNVIKSTADFSKVGAYVPQDEALVGILTVRETLMFAAKLTLGGKSAADIKRKVEHLITEMGLRVCADTMVGTVFFKGLSGGQKRRLSVAVELMRDPSLLVLDEPTSGLDAASAFAEIQHMKELTKHGHTVVLSIHQPSSEIWDLFDKVGFLTRGRTAYFGPAGQNCLDFFKKAGYPCPNYTNPADHVIRVINQDFPGNKADVDGLITFYQKNADQYIDAKKGEGKNSSDDTKKPAQFQNHPRPWFISRLWALIQRNFLETIRDPGIMGVRLVMYTMLALVIGLMYLNLGDDKDFESISSRISALFFVAAFMVFMSVAVLPFFIWQRDIFVKERSNGAYDVPEYVLAKFIVSIPGIFLLSILTTMFVVLLAKLNGFGVYLGTLFLSLLVAEAFMSLMGVLVPHYIIGIALAAGVFGFFMLCQGFFIVFDEIPPWFIWGYYIGFHTYSFRLFMYNEFNPIDSFESIQFADGEAVLKFYSMDNVDVGSDMAILLAFTIAFQIMFGYVLWSWHTGKR